jgi:molybdopterin synthase catalytic subunit
MHLIVYEPIILSDYLQHVEEASHGAICSFLGVVRNHHEGNCVQRIEYHCYEEMALKMLARIEEEIEAKFPGVKSALVHRVGMVELSEASVLVLSGSAHRKDAYAANIYAMDRIKEILPVWKKEFHPDGESSWVGIGS